MKCEVIQKFTAVLRCNRGNLSMTTWIKNEINELSQCSIESEVFREPYFTLLNHGNNPSNSYLLHLPAPLQFSFLELGDHLAGNADGGGVVGRWPRENQAASAISLPSTRMGWCSSASATKPIIIEPDSGQGWLL